MTTDTPAAAKPGGDCRVRLERSYAIKVGGDDHGVMGRRDLEALFGRPEGKHCETALEDGPFCELSWPRFGLEVRVDGLDQSAGVIGVEQGGQDDPECLPLPSAACSPFVGAEKRVAIATATLSAGGWDDGDTTACVGTDCLYIESAHFKRAPTAQKTVRLIDGSLWLAAWGGKGRLFLGNGEDRSLSIGKDFSFADSDVAVSMVNDHAIAVATREPGVLVLDSNTGKVLGKYAPRVRGDARRPSVTLLDTGTIAYVYDDEDAARHIVWLTFDGKKLVPRSEIVGPACR